MSYTSNMISLIHGTIYNIDTKAVYLQTHPLGYKIYCRPSTLSGWSLGKEIALHTSMVVRENVMDLYGFTTSEERDFFEVLIGVSGIGPRSALAILDLDNVSALKSAIASNNITYLTKVSGIGKKTAEKILLELRDKLEVLATENLTEHSDTLDALVAMGYSERQARESLKQVDESITDTSEKIRAALSQINP